MEGGNDILHTRTGFREEHASRRAVAFNSWTNGNNSSTRISVDLTSARYSNYDDNTGSIMEGGKRYSSHTHLVARRTLFATRGAFNSWIPRNNDSTRISNDLTAARYGRSG